MADNLKDAATEIGLSPVQTVIVDGASATIQKVDEIKKAAQFVASDSAAKLPGFGMRMSHMISVGIR